MGSPFLEILVSSSCFSSATVSASYGVDLGGFASLLLSETIRDISSLILDSRFANAVQWV